MDSTVKIIKTHLIPITNEQDIVTVRKQVREWSTQAQFTLINQTKIMTAASELARNIIKYATEGHVILNLIQNDKKTGLQLIFEDQGPGIPDIKKAMQDGYSTGNSLGLGLSGARRLMNEFQLASEVNKGTKISILLWK